MRITTPVRFAALAAVSLSGLVYAASTTAPSGPTDAQRVAELPGLERDVAELKGLSERLGKDVTDPRGYRHEAKGHVDQALSLLQQEVAEYKGDETKK